MFSFRDGKKFDLGMYPTGSVKRIVFDKPGLARLFCNIHPNMAAYIMAVDSPSFAVSNEKGAHDPECPPGTYTYHAWRPGGQPLTGSISVDGTTPLKSVGHNHPRTVRLCGRAARDSPARAQATIAANST